MDRSHYTISDHCRVCRGELSPVLDLGEQVACCHYPLPDEPDGPTAPLVLARCTSCGLPQLTVTADATMLYRDGYGYRSGLTDTMRGHLRGIVDSLRPCLKLAASGNVLDIGCNDGTLLGFWGDGVNRVGYDPNPAMERDDVTYIQAPFTAQDWWHRFPHRRARVVTSIAMLYDLDDPKAFVSDVCDVLHTGGTWCAEFMSAPALIRGAWDQINHEHLTYYGLRHFETLLEGRGLRTRLAVRTPINGGSLRMYVTRGGYVPDPTLEAMRARETYVDDADVLSGFAGAVRASIADIRSAVRSFDRVGVLGASQKGNTVLQACGLTADDICFAVERDPNKVGRVTPGSRIPIISEDEARKDPPDAYLVLAWQFEDEIRKREAAFIEQGGRLILPLPVLRVV